MQFPIEKRLLRVILKLYSTIKVEKNNAYADFIDKSFDNVRYVKVNSLSSFNQHLTPKHFVDDAIDEISSVRKKSN